MSYRDDTLAGKDLSTREREVLAAHDAGKTDAEIAEMFGYASANGAGNVRRVAMTKSGRGAEVNAGTRGGGGGGGSRTKAPKVPDAVAAITAIVEQTRSTLDGLRTRMEELESATEAKPAAILKREHDRLTETLTRAQDALADFDGMDSAAKKDFVDKARTEATSRREREESAIREGITSGEAELAKMEAMLAAVSATE